MEKESAVTLSALEKSFSNGWGRRTVALHPLSLDIFEGEIFGYLGANGAGKTTTFKLMLGLISPDQGEIRFWGQPSTDYRVRSLVGYLPENPYFYSYLTARESLAFYSGLFDMDRAIRKRRIDELLDRVGLSHAGDIQMRKFSRGMLQRIGIAQALVNDPKLLILDEPMSGLDPMGRKDMRDIILSCRDQGKTVIFSSHIISDVEMICDRASILSKGKLRHVIDMESVLSSDVDAWEVVCQGRQLDVSALEVEATVTQNIVGNRNILSTPAKSVALKLIDMVSDQGLDFISFTPRRKSLEDVYITTAETAMKKDSAHG